MSNTRAHPYFSDISSDLVLELLSQLMIFRVVGRKRYLILFGINKMKHFQVYYSCQLSLGSVFELYFTE